MIGNVADATLARTMPWEFHLASGSTREVFLINGVVYKVENGDLPKVNQREYLCMTLETSLPDGVFFPSVAMYDDVIAMEYINGTPVAECYCGPAGDRCDETCMTNDVYELVAAVLEDVSGFNVILNGNGIYIIDMGEWSGW